MDSPKEILEYALEEHDALSGGSARIFDNAVIWNEYLRIAIEGDLKSLQMHPSINQDRRRFVCLRAEEEDRLRLHERGGVCDLVVSLATSITHCLFQFEWIAPSEFSFQDE